MIHVFSRFRDFKKRLEFSTDLTDMDNPDMSLIHGTGFCWAGYSLNGVNLYIMGVLRRTLTSKRR